MEKVSVIIPVHNGEKTLRQCLSSVLDQTYKNYEVIVVDNNSDDKSKDIIKEFQARNNMLQYAFENYKSKGRARNTGILTSKDEIIAMTDCDCVVPGNWLEELIKLISSNNEQAVAGFDENITKNYWSDNIQKSNALFTERNRDGNYISHIDTKNFAVKASLIRELMFDSQLRSLEDFDLFLRLRKRAHIRFLPHLKVRHYHRDSFIGTVKTNFERGYWLAKVLKKYKGDGSNNYPMTESISLKNFISFPLWMLLQFAKRPIGETYFLLVSELSWRCGIIWAHAAK